MEELKRLNLVWGWSGCCCVWCVCVWFDAIVIRARRQSGKSLPSPTSMEEQFPFLNITTQKSCFLWTSPPNAGTPTKTTWRFSSFFTSFFSSILTKAKAPRTTQKIQPSGASDFGLPLQPVREPGKLARDPNFGFCSFQILSWVPSFSKNWCQRGQGPPFVQISQVWGWVLWLWYWVEFREVFDGEWWSCGPVWFWHPALSIGERNRTHVEERIICLNRICWKKKKMKKVRISTNFIEWGVHRWCWNLGNIFPFKKGQQNPFHG